MCTTSCPVNSVHFTLHISLCVIQLHITLQSHGCVLEVHTILCTISAHYTVDTAIYLILCLTHSSLSPRYREQTVHCSELNCPAHYCELHFPYTLKLHTVYCTLHAIQSTMYRVHSILCGISGNLAPLLQIALLSIAHCTQA